MVILLYCDMKCFCSLFQSNLFSFIHYVFHQLLSSLYSIFPLFIVGILLSIAIAVDPPGPITLRNPSGEVTTDVVLMKYIPTGDFLFESTTADGNWSLEPSLPMGVYMDKEARRISGTPSMDMTRKLYNLTLTNSAGSSSLLFFIEVTLCSEGFYVVREVGDMRGGHFSLKYDNTVLEDKDYSASIEDSYFCIANGNLEFTLSCTESSYDNCMGRVSSTNNNVFIHLIVKPGENQTAVISMTPTSAPSISVDSKDIIVPSKTNVNFILTVRGVYSTISFNPSLPDGLSFSSDRLSIKGSISQSGVYRSTILASNSIGTTEVPLTFYVDNCPEQQQPLKLSSSSSIEGGYLLSSLDGTVLTNRTIDTHPFYSLHCLPAGEYKLSMYGSLEKPIWENGLLSHDSNGVLIESFQKTSSDSLQEERFVIGDFVNEASQFAYIVADRMDANWVSKKFNEKNWKMGVSGQWGRFDSHNGAYFRRQFTISNPLKYSQMLIEVTVVHATELFLNGVKIGSMKTKDKAVTSRLYLPSTYLVENVNQVALSVKGVTGAEIIFSMRFHLITSQCLLPTLSGIASSNEKNPISGHEVENAFSENYSWWESRQVPVEMKYTLNDDGNFMPSSLTMATDSSEDARPLSFDVFGVVLDPSTSAVKSEDLIGSVSCHSFLIGTTVERVELNPKQPYNSIRIVFNQSSGDQTLRVKGITFQTCQESKCKKKIGRKSVRVGSVVTENCSIGSYGINQYRCGRKDVEPVWIEDSSMCLAKFAPKAFAYVDTSFVVNGMRKNSLSTIQRVVNSIVPNVLIVKSQEITFPLLVETVDETVSLDVTMRFTIDRELGKYVEKTMKAYQSQFVDSMKEQLKNDVKISVETKLYLPFPWQNVIIVIIVIVLLVIAFMLGLLCMSSISRKGVKSPRKSLRKADHESLLDSTDVYLVSL